LLRSTVELSSGHKKRPDICHLRLHYKYMHEGMTPCSDDIPKRLEPVFNALFRFPLTERAKESLGRQMRLGITDEGLADLVIRLHEESRLSVITEITEEPEPQIVCSLGLASTNAHEQTYMRFALKSRGSV
jgi:hypothetical protein